MKHVPGYLMPGHKKGVRALGKGRVRVGFHKNPRPKNRDDEGSSKSHGHGGKGSKGSSGGKVLGDPSLFACRVCLCPILLFFFFPRRVIIP